MMLLPKPLNRHTVSKAAALSRCWRSCCIAAASNVLLPWCSYSHCAPLCCCRRFQLALSWCFFHRPALRCSVCGGHGLIFACRLSFVVVVTVIYDDGMMVSSSLHRCFVKWAKQQIYLVDIYIKCVCWKGYQCTEVYLPPDKRTIL